MSPSGPWDITVRKVILHYHIFKNAGTSVDHMLATSFGARWKSVEASTNGRLSSADVAKALQQDPSLAAVSSHTALPPVPAGPFQVFPIVFVRHPIDRAYSAYDFEWIKQAGGMPKGSFEAYVTEKLTTWRSSAIEDFQTLHLSNRDPERRTVQRNLPNEVLLDNARQFLRGSPFFGVVERMGDSLALMKHALGPHFPELRVEEHKLNVLRPEGTLAEKVEEISSKLPPPLYKQLVLRNQLDLRLYEYALGLFDARLAQIGAEASRGG